MGYRGHKDLIIWQKSMDLVEEIYQISSFFPKEEMYGLSSQIRRAIVSVPSNIAEGAGREGKKEFKKFLYIALGSISEVETQILIAKRLNYIDECDTILKKIWNIKKMIKNFIIKLEG